MSDNPPPESFLAPSSDVTPEVLRKLAQQPVLGAATGSIFDTLDCPPPDKAEPELPFPAPQQLAQDAARQVVQAVRNQGLPCWIANIAGQVISLTVFWFTLITGLSMWAFEILSPPLLNIGLNMIDQFREQMDPRVGDVSILVLNELLGTEFKMAAVSEEKTLAGHIARAGQVGALFHEQMLQNFTENEASTQTVGRGGAVRLTGQIVNFGTATALLGLLGEVASIGQFKNFRLIGEQVTTGLGLGRMNRLAMRPLIQTCVAQPYQWWLNRKFHPTQFNAAEIANPFTQTLLDKDQVYKALDLEGWSDDKKQALIELHQKRLSTDDVEILKRWGYWDETSTHKYLVKLGWPEELADTAGRIPELKRIDARITKLIDKLESAVDAGHMTADDALALIKTLPVTEDERAVIQATMMTFVKVPHKSLTLTEIEKAFENGLITVDDVIARLQQAGFQGDDLSVLVELVLLKFAHDQEAKAAAQTRHDQQVSKAKAKGTAVPKKPAILA
jgi:hypothetical protein